MIDESILGCIMLGLQGTEECLLCPQDLDGTSRMLGQIEEGASMGYQACTHQLSYHDGEVRSDGHHAVLEVFE